jgi:hypothetical protein
MGKRGWVSAAALVAACGAALLGVRPGAADTATNGVFRFLTSSLPEGSTNSEYVARVLVANADGPVTFTMTSLASGTTYDSQSGFITGRPDTVGNFDVDITAFDGTNTIMQNNVLMKITAAGGGGNAGATFDAASLPSGRVGEAYTTTLTMSNTSGTPVFGATDLPPGLSLNGSTGVIAGTPLAAGTFYVTLSAYDPGDGNKVARILPLTVLPPGLSAFKFDTQFLNNGEVGTPYHQQIVVSGNAGSISYGTSGLPAGLSMDGAGLITGTPTEAGTFIVSLTASDADGSIVTNLSVFIVPSATSEMYWDFFGIPAAIVNVDYTRQPPIAVAVVNNTGTVTYAVVGVPAGMLFNATSGELSGTPVEVGEYPMTVTATDGTTAEVLTISFDFVVLPATGGDTSAITTNLFVTKAVLKPGADADGSWKGQAFYNADRRAAGIFDPLTDAVSLEIGSFGVQLDPGSLAGTPAKYAFASPSGEAPAVKVQLSPAKQTLKWAVGNATFTESVPATLRHTTILGGRGYRLDEAFTDRGAFKPALAYRRKAFVATKGTITALGAGNDAIKLSLLMADPGFTYESGVSLLRFRLLNGATVLFDRDFTLLGTATTGEDGATGATTYKMKGLADPDATDRLAKFAFLSQKGKMALAFSDLTLTGLPTVEAHLGLELTIGDRIYITTVTFFETDTGKYTTKMP